MKILVTGGAGFIGSHIVDSLLKEGHNVIVFDNLEPQVHGNKDSMPDYLSKDVEFIKGDVRNKSELKKIIKGVEVIFHKAAVVGVGQSMYQIHKYVDVNILGTANLLDILVNTKNKVRKLIVASSMSIYGEGKYKCKKCGIIFPRLRSEKQLKKQDWEMHCYICGKIVGQIPTDEDKVQFPTSIYATTKKTQEEMCLETGKAYKIPTVAFRYFNVYGSRQALSNPYTGVAAIFCSSIINNKQPIIFEDGKQTRDFIHVKDIVKANILALHSKNSDYEAFNVGTGKQTNLLNLFNMLQDKFGKRNVNPNIINKYREGDIRHCYADISRIQNKLLFKPEIDLEDGVADLVEWVKTQIAKYKAESHRRFSLVEAKKVLMELNHKKLII